MHKMVHSEILLAAAVVWVFIVIGLNGVLMNSVLVEGG